MSLLEHRARPLPDPTVDAPVDAPVDVPADVVAPLELVAPDAWRARRRMRLAAAALGLFVVAAAFTTVALRVLIAQQQYELQRLRVTQEQAQRRNADLRATVTELSSGSRIVGKARELGLDFPGVVTPLAVPRGTPPPQAPTVPSALADYAQTKPSLVAPGP